MIGPAIPMGTHVTINRFWTILTPNPRQIHLLVAVAWVTAAEMTKTMLENSTGEGGSLGKC